MTPITRLVYKYGLLRPIENADEVDTQMRLAHRYRNDLTQIEIGRRNAICDLESKIGNIEALAASLAEANAAVEAAKLEIKRHRAKTRTRSETADQKEALRFARTVQRATLDTLREARRAAKDPAIIEEQKKIQSLSYELTKNCFATNTGSLFHGQRALVEAAADQAFNYKKTPLYKGANRHYPKFKRFTHEGQLGMQIQDGLTWGELRSGQDNRARIEMGGSLGKGADPNSKRSQKNKRMILALRINSVGRDPVFARFPMIMHRELPEDAKVVQVKISCKNHGRRDEWSVDLTVELPAPQRRPILPTGTVSVDIGWRLLGDEMRVASWRGKDGNNSELRLDKRLVNGIRIPERIRSVRDKAFDLALARLISDLTDLTLPEWLLRSTVRRETETPTQAQALAYLSGWKSTAKLAALCRRWTPFEGDEIAYWSLETWRYRDRHLWDYESGQRRSVLRSRKQFYRTFAKQLAEKYDTLVIEDFDLRPIAKRKEDEAENETARSNRQLAAVSELRSCLVQAFWRRGGRVAKVPPQDSTHICHVCGSLEAFDAETILVHTCSACASVWDQDVNAAHVLLARFERLSGPQNPGPAREKIEWLELPIKGDSKFVKRTNLKETKDAEKDSSRNLQDEAAE